MPQTKKICKKLVSELKERIENEMTSYDKGYIDAMKKCLSMFGVSVPNPDIVCAREGCERKFYSTSGRYAKKYCSNSCRVRACRLRKPSDGIQVLSLHKEV
jgi:hypothetical protein